MMTLGSTGFAHSVWLNGTFLGSWVGNGAFSNFTQSFQLPPLDEGCSYVITVLIDHLGYEENFLIGSDSMKFLRGIIDFRLSGHNQSDVSWRMTGNLSGEDYHDHSRGPLN